jgi:hypothetical protein
LNKYYVSINPTLRYYFTQRFFIEPLIAFSYFDSGFQTGPNQWSKTVKRCTYDIGFSNGFNFKIKNSLFWGTGFCFTSDIDLTTDDRRDALFKNC